MKTIIVTSLLIGAMSFAPGMRAAAATDAPVAPTTPPPAVSPFAGQISAPNQIVYVPQLPTAQELTNAGNAQGLAIEQIAETGSQISVTYKSGSGQTNTVTYQVLPNAQPGTSQTVVIPTTPAPTVVYQPAQRVVYYYPARSDYYSDYGYYPDRYWYSPVSLSLGFGFGYYGGYRSHVGFRSMGGYRGHGGYNGGHGYHHR